MKRILFVLCCFFSVATHAQSLEGEQLTAFDAICPGDNMRAVWAEPLGGAVEGWVNLVCLDEELQQTMQWFLSPEGMLFESIEDQIPPFVRPFAETGLTEKILALGDDQTITLWLDFVIEEPALPSLEFYGALPGAAISGSAATTSDAPVIATYYIDGVEVSEEEFLRWQQAYLSAQRAQTEERDQLVRAQAVSTLSMLVDRNNWHGWLNVDAIAEGQLQRPGWIFASTLILDINGRRARQLLETGESLVHISEYLEASTDGDQGGVASLTISSDTTHSILVDDNLISWPDDGWYQVQSVVDYSSVCEGGSSCSVTPGDYVVINHTTGVRNSISVAGNAFEDNTPSSQISVSGNTISWLDDGWYQVQTLDDYSSVCEGGSFCEVSPGTYIVINHSTGVRSEITVAGQDELPTPSAGGISLTDGTLSWPDDGWYQVQTRDDYISVCEGGRSCILPVGNYVVINHTTQARTPVTIDSSSLFAAPQTGIPLDGAPIVQGLQISWFDPGWYQVQSQTTLQSVCEGVLTCTVEPGVYIVINHTTGQRWENIVAPGSSTVSTSPTNLFNDDDGDGTINFLDVDFTGGLDANFDGIDDLYQPLTNPNGDNDQDGIENFRDVDFTGGFDTNFDGIDDIVQPLVNLNGDHDQDGILNFEDVDLTGGSDDDFDGIDDNFQPLVQPPDTNPCNGTPGTDADSSNDDWGDNCFLERDGVHAESSYVRGVQRILACLGYPVNDDAIFDSATEQAVIAFQSDNPPLAVDGIVNTVTWRALRNTLEGQPFDLNHDGYAVGFYDPDGDGIDNSICQGEWLFYQFVDRAFLGDWKMAETPGSASRVPFSIGF